MEKTKLEFIVGVFVLVWHCLSRLSLDQTRETRADRRQRL